MHLSILAFATQNGDVRAARGHRLRVDERLPTIDEAAAYAA
jgi:hypothetical protein